MTSTASIGNLRIGSQNLSATSTILNVRLLKPAQTVIVAAPLGVQPDVVTTVVTAMTAVGTTVLKSSNPLYFLMIEPIWCLVAAFILFILWLIWKIVVTPNVVLTVVTDKASYNRGEPVVISGLLTGDGTPIAGETITGAIVLPGGTGTHNFSATTQADGSYEYTYDTTGGAGGTYTVQVAGFGQVGSTTFTQINQNVEDVLLYRVPIYA